MTTGEDIQTKNPASPFTLVDLIHNWTITLFGIHIQVCGSQIVHENRASLC